MPLQFVGILQVSYIIPAKSAKATWYKKNARYKKCVLTLNWVLW